MDSAQLFKVAFALFLVFLNGFFVAAEFSFVKSRSTRLQELADAGSFLARTALHEITHLDVYLSTTQVGITLASLGLGWVGEPAFAELVEPLFEHAGWLSVVAAHAVGVTLAFSIITYLHILFGELVPKTLSILKAEKVALAVSVPLHLFFYLFYPIIWVLNRSSNLVLRAIGLRPAGGHVSAHTEEEIRMILAESARGGSLKDSEVLLVERSFEFADTPVHAVMVPRVDIDYLSLQWETPRILQQLEEHPHARYVVVEEEDVDNVVGFVHLKEIVPQIAKGQLDLKTIMRPLHVVPESQSIERLLREFQTRHSKIALVLDEYGGTAGIVTSEDLVEELVGEVSDELDEEPPALLKSGDHYLIQAATALTDVSRTLDEELESEHFDTLGGWIMGTLERVPKVGDRAESLHYSFEVVKMDGPRVVEVKAIPKPKSAPTNPETVADDRTDALEDAPPHV
jgi:CBS domain containing-hemolysin-like protein